MNLINYCNFSFWSIQKFRWDNSGESLKSTNQKIFFARNVPRLLLSWIFGKLPIIPRGTIYEILYQIMCCHLTVYLLRYVWTFGNYNYSIKWTLRIQNLTFFSLMFSGSSPTKSKFKKGDSGSGLLKSKSGFLFRSKTPTAELYSTQEREQVPNRPKTPLVNMSVRSKTPVTVQQPVC